MSTQEVRLRSTLAGFTAEEKLHTLSVWFILALRVMIGLAFFQSGLGKVLSGSFSAAGRRGFETGHTGRPFYF
ncbi:hypothetical protein SAMN05443636_1362 [Halobaculum gomorrense]|uniref:DoxX protein n=1 Tax=Halobaculum gomorrense TaxID=43928 RepID=A0A1M5NVM0_9EURY|nr:hypothetical protein [Halobaculum gomorrense]SHG93581.1 hypothetical protein SAMN05443636_1362 [Halobaculum gomorrense]